MKNERLPAVAWVFSGLLFLITTGCGGKVQVQVGDPLNIEVLRSNLILGESTKEEVLSVLGVPVGRGRAMLPIDKEPRTLWYYDHLDMTVSLGDEKSESEETMLWVYFKDDIYDGYFWSSTFPRFSKKM